MANQVQWHESTQEATNTVQADTTSGAVTWAQQAVWIPNHRSVMGRTMPQRTIAQGQPLQTGGVWHAEMKDLKRKEMSAKSGVWSQTKQMQLIMCSNTFYFVWRWSISTDLCKENQVGAGGKVHGVWKFSLSPGMMAQSSLVYFLPTFTHTSPWVSGQIHISRFRLAFGIETRVVYKVKHKPKHSLWTTGHSYLWLCREPNLTY